MALRAAAASCSWNSDFQVNVLTKSSFAAAQSRHIRRLQGGYRRDYHHPGQRLRKFWEPGAATIEERLQIIAAARQAGLKTTIMFAPLLPMLSDSPQSLEAMLQRAADLKVDKIWVDSLNPRPRVWASVAGLLRQHFPELRIATAESCSIRKSEPIISPSYTARSTEQLNACI